MGRRLRVATRACLVRRVSLSVALPRPRFRGLAGLLRPPLLLLGLSMQLRRGPQEPRRPLQRRSCTSKHCGLLLLHRRSCAAKNRGLLLRLQLSCQQL